MKKLLAIVATLLFVACAGPKAEEAPVGDQQVDVVEEAAAPAEEAPAEEVSAEATE